jgi:hypothetical protein
MEKVALEDLPLFDPHGRQVPLSDCFQEYLLLIFLRHLA